MTLNDVYNFLFSWIDIVMNGKRALGSYQLQSIGSCTFTYNSNTVIGVDFITNGIIQAGNFIRIGSDIWMEVASIDTETSLTLVDVYTGPTDTATSYYSEVGINVIIGSDNAPAPGKQYIVIHEPPMSNMKIGDTQRKKIYVDLTDDSYMDYTNTWRCSINLEEVNSNGIYLQKLMNSFQEDAIQDLWDAQKTISLESMQAGSANNSLIGDIIEKRYNYEIFLMYSEEETIETEIIETVNISGRNYIRGG